jgi:hypothetical protein
MKDANFCLHWTRRTALAVAAFAGLFVFATSVRAGPGAHGPDGEHLDQPSAASAAALPRVEAHTDQYELVAALRAGELVILIDRYETNEPVLGAALTVESGGIQAQAKFRGDLSDYAVDDPKLLQLLAAPGEHALVFTLVHQGDADLLDGTLRTPDRSHNGHQHSYWTEYLVGAAIVAVIIGGLALLWRRRATRACLAVTAVAVGALALLTVSPVMAGPGAHGPGGEHLDAPLRLLGHVDAAVRQPREAGGVGGRPRRIEVFAAGAVCTRPGHHR